MDIDQMMQREPEQVFDPHHELMIKVTIHYAARIKGGCSGLISIL
jgi:hypothetical protein